MKTARIYFEELPPDITKSEYSVGVRCRNCGSRQQAVIDRGVSVPTAVAAVACGCCGVSGDLQREVTQCQA